MTEFEFERSEILTNLALLEDHAQKFPCPFCMEKHLSKVIGYAEEIDMGERDAEMEELADWARKWRRRIQGAKEHSHSYNPAGVPKYGKLFHFPICPKAKFDPESFRVIELGKEIKATIGCPKGHFVAGRCKVGMVTQKLLFPQDWTQTEVKDWVKEHQVKCRLQSSAGKKLVIEVMAEREGLNVRRLGEQDGFLKFNVYGDSKYAINRVAGKLSRRGCTIQRFRDPYSINVLCPLKG